MLAKFISLFWIGLAHVSRRQSISTPQLSVSKWYHLQPEEEDMWLVVQRGLQETLTQDQIIRPWRWRIYRRCTRIDRNTKQMGLIRKNFFTTPVTLREQHPLNNHTIRRFPISFTLLEAFTYKTMILFTDPWTVEWGVIQLPHVCVKGSLC